jgi:hypothetical protein
LCLRGWKSVDQIEELPFILGSCRFLEGLISQSLRVDDPDCVSQHLGQLFIHLASGAASFFRKPAKPT